MEKIIDKNDDGTLTEDQQERFMLGIASVTRKAFERFAQMSDEEILQAFRSPNESEAYTQAVNDVFQAVVEEDLPQVFNDYIEKMASTICEKTFAEVAKKSNDNLTALIGHITGTPYEDLSPKDVMEQLQKLEAAENVETEDVNPTQE